jgi:hypothetical protein
MKFKKTDQSIDGVVTKSLHTVRDEGRYNASLLPFPLSATARVRKKISIEGKALHNVLVGTGVHFRDEDIKRSYDITETEGAFGMLINDREFDVHQTAPQCTATALIVCEIARQANLSRKALKYSAGKPATFELVLDGMDKIANAIGPLANYRRFQMDVDMAAAAIFENTERVDELFDAMGNCNKDLLFSQAARFSVVRGEGRIQTIEVITDAKPAHIASAVRKSGLFDFSVGSAPIHDPRFMDSLVKHLEQQRQNAMKLH